MALIKCTECGNMVSDKAEKCPHCGCPVSIILSETAKSPENPPVQEPAHRPAPAPKASVTAAPAAEPPISKPPAETQDAQAAHDKKVQQGFIFAMCLVVLCIIGVMATSANQPVPAKSPTTPTTQTSGHSSKHTSSSSSSSSSGSSSTINTARHSDEDAFYCATLIVEDYLKAPSTAKFCKQSDATVTHLGNGEYMVTGWVDAENSYGAMIRSDFVVTYTATEKGFKNGNAIIG